MSGIGVDGANMDGNTYSGSLAKSVGVEFAYLRADYSATDDPTYKREAPRARAAGVKPGPYFFPDESIIARPMAEQVAAFAADVRETEQPGDLPAAFDVEYGKGTRATGRTRGQLLALIVEIATLLRAALGYWPVLYTSARVIDGEDTDALDADGQHDVDLSPLKNCPLWASRYITGYHQPPIGDTPEERAKLFALPLPPVPKYLGDAKNIWFRQTQGDAIGLSGVNHTIDVNIFYTMSRGESGERVSAAQRQLGMVEGTPGVFDDVMAEAVGKFQADEGLDVDKTIGVDTFSRLFRLGR